jgi:hypothetical protein
MNALSNATNYIASAILRDLRSGKSTVEAIAERNNYRAYEIQIAMDELEQDCKVTSQQINGGKFRVYMLR